jgi:hypothetical protein
MGLGSSGLRKQSPRGLSGALPELAALSVLAVFAGGLVAGAATGALTGKNHRFTASYSGRGSGRADGTTASGSATLTGRGSLIGRSTLSGSARGVFTSRTCVTFSGRAELEGGKGSLRLVARHAHACAAGGGSTVSFSGTATIAGGTATFAGAQGRVSFTGSYDRQSGSVKISLSGVIRY